MKFCPTCDRQFSDDATECSVDGSRLLSAKSPSEALADALIGKTLDDRYEISAPLGHGGMGVVFRGIQTAVGRPVAIKVLNQEVATQVRAVKRFMQEARAASALSHPNTVTIHDFGQTPEGLLYLVMELIDGQTLTDLLDKGPLPLEVSVRIVTQVLNALNEAHQMGIVHRDLKPENVLISKRSGNQYFAQVLDFGLAKVVDGTGSDDNITQTGQIFGTPGYMSPEQARGTECTARVDVYATGVMLFEMLAGRRPFTGDNALSVLVKHMNTLPPEFDSLDPPVNVPAPIADVVRQALSKNAADRFSASEMHDRLVEGLKASGVSAGLRTHSSQVALGALTGLEATSDSLPSAPEMSEDFTGMIARSGPKPAMLAAGLLLLGGAGFVIYMATQGDGDPQPDAAVVGASTTPHRVIDAGPVVDATAKPAPDAAKPVPDAAPAKPVPDAAVAVAMAPIRLTSRRASTVSVWIDGEAVESDKSTPLDLKAPVGARIKAVFKRGRRSVTREGVASPDLELKAAFPAARPVRPVRKPTPPEPVKKPTPKPPAGGVDDLK